MPILPNFYGPEYDIIFSGFINRNLKIAKSRIDSSRLKPIFERFSQQISMQENLQMFKHLTQ